MKDKINALLDELLAPWKKKWEEEWLPQLLEAKKQWNLFTTAVKTFWDEKVKPIIDVIDKIFPADGFIKNLGEVTGLFLLGAIAATLFSGAVAIITAVLGSALFPLLAIIATLAILKTAWDNNWLGMRDTLTKFWEDSAQPKLNDIKLWLEEKIPVAGEGISTFFKDTLPGAFDTVATAISDVLMPPFESIKEFFEEYLIPLWDAWKEVMTALEEKIGEFATAFLENVLFPKLEELHEWWDEKIAPILQAIIDEILPPLQEGLQILSDVITGVIADALVPLKEAWEDIKDAIDKVIEWLGNLAEKIKSIKVPGWMQGGSPPPMANWLMDIAGAAALAGGALGDMGDVPLISRSLRPGGNVGGAGTAYGDTFNFNQTVNTRATQMNTIRDFSMARALYGN